jgi:hypothetical protein
MFNVQTLAETGDRPDRRKVFYSNIWRFISSYPEFFILTTGKYIQVLLTAKKFSETASCAFAQTVLNCQQQHENTQGLKTKKNYVEKPKSSYICLIFETKHLALNFRYVYGKNVTHILYQTTQSPVFLALSRVSMQN